MESALVAETTSEVQQGQTLWERGDDHQRILNWFYLVSAVILFIVFGAFFQASFDYLLSHVFAEATWAFQIERLQEQFHFNIGHVFGLAAALGAVASLRFNPKSNQFGLEAVAELKKVTWSTMEVTWKSTVAVIITVSICAVMLGFFDLMWSALSRWILQ